MALWDCTGRIIGSTGICSGHMAYYPSKATRDADNNGGHIVGTFSEYSYTRPDSQSINARASGSIHVDMPYSSLTEADYVMFQNTDLEDRWYYGRIVHREYVNISSCRLWFDMDWYSSFQDKLMLKSCFVERTHVKLKDDWNGIYPTYKYMNTEPINPQLHEEPFQKWWSNFEGVNDLLKPSSYVLLATTNAIGNIPTTMEKFGDFPLACFKIICTSGAELQSWIEDYHSNSWVAKDTSNVNNIIGVYYVPVGAGYETGKYNRKLTKLSRDDISRTDGEKIQSAKCLCYPYSFPVVKSASGEQLVIRHDIDSSTEVNVKFVVGGGTDTRAIMYVDRGNEGIEAQYIKTQQYPQIPITSDGYATWAAQNSASVGSQALIGIATIAVGAAIASVPGAGTMAGAGTIIKGASSLISAGAKNIDAMSLPDTQVGGSTSPLAAALGLYTFKPYLNRPNEEDITSIDDYFITYGYAVNRFMEPNLKVRQYWTYVKTSNATVRGACPSEAIEYTKNMLDNGCTFWNRQAGVIGDYKAVNPDA